MIVRDVCPKCFCRNIVTGCDPFRYASCFVCGWREELGVDVEDQVRVDSRGRVAWGSWRKERVDCED